MSNPMPNDVHIDQALTNVSIKYSNASFVGEKLFQPVEVNKDSNVYFIYGKQDFSIFNTVRAPGTRAKQFEWKVEKSSPYFTIEHALEAQLVDEVRDNADDPIKYDADTTEMVTQTLLLDEEKTLADIAQNTSNYATGHSETLSGTSQWSDYVNSNPLTKVRNCKEVVRSKIYVYPNTMIVSAKVHSALLDHPAVVERIKYTQLGVTTEQLLARLFEVDNYIVAGGAYNSAKEGQAESMTDLWGKSVVLAYVNPRPSIKSLSFAYLFRRKGYRMVERWRENALRCDWLRVSDKYDPRIISNVAGYLMKDVVA